MAGGRPKGSVTRPQISDYIGNEDIIALVKVAKEKALAGDAVMTKFLLEQSFGKAPQNLEVEGSLSLSVKFDGIFKAPQ